MQNLNAIERAYHACVKGEADALKMLKKKLWAKCKTNPKAAILTMRRLLMPFAEYKQYLMNFDPTNDAEGAHLFADLLNYAAKDPAIGHKDVYYLFKGYAIWFAIRMGCKPYWANPKIAGNNIVSIALVSATGASFYHDPDRSKLETLKVHYADILEKRSAEGFTPSVSRFKKIRAFFEYYKKGKTHPLSKKSIKFLERTQKC
ncbi:MAG: hypothetical protein ACI9TY_000071 [Alphaproteobacteria bacterium]|jgi:hypothetical protein